MSRGIDPEHRATRCLKDHDVRTPPVPVEELALALGVEVVVRALDANTSALLVRHDDGAATIAVNKAHHVNRRRFSIAHELGHYVMHTDSPAVFVDGAMIDFRDRRSAAGDDWREIQANRFAAALLMPRSFLLADLGAAFDVLDDDDETLGRLAKRYRVSRQAMTFRLVDLKILRGWSR